MNPRVRAFLVDDEDLALGHLADLLEQTGRVEIVGRATRAAEVLTAPAARAAEVLFVDIHMHGMSGLELVERLPAGPAVVVTTGYDRYAVQAFEVSAVDYLMKPIRRERLERALDRVEARRAEPGGAGQRALERLAASLRGRPGRTWIACRCRGTSTSGSSRWPPSRTSSPRPKGRGP